MGWIEWELSAQGLRIGLAGRPWIEDLGLELVIAGRRYSTADGSLERLGHWPLAGEDKLGPYRGLGLVYGWTTELLELRLKAYGNQALIELEALQELEGTTIADSFYNTTFNLVFYLRDGKFLLYTWGLRHAGEPGRWPEGITGQNLSELPREPFAPIVLWTDEGALALAPANYFLTSPLRLWPAEAERGRPAIAHGFHGAVERVPQGTIRKTALAFAEEGEPARALYTLGDLLLKLGGKERPGPLADLLLERLSYWNDYGAYYSHPFNPIDERKLLELADYFRREGLPVGYYGLDLWYRFKEIGRATDYRPDPERFPRGLGAIAEETGLPFLLHLSAFAREFAAEGHKFVPGEGSSHPAEPRRFYRELGKRLKGEGACGVWHDWLWVQQSSVRRLRADPEQAERWFAEMAAAFAEEGLPMLLCMPTMGFHLASTCHENIIAARSYCDYLNTQPGQVERARALGLEAELIPMQRYLQQNLLVGLVLHALGVHPFYDAFITNGEHPEGFAEAQPEERALFCALSAGPVGIGDKLGCVDKKVVERLTLPDGRLAKPDRPPWPLFDFSLNIVPELMVAWTETQIGELHWRYLLLANVGDRPAEARLNLKQLFDEEFIAYDCLSGRLLAQDGLKVSLEPARLRCYLLAPRRAGMALIGLQGRYVPMPHGLVEGLRIAEEGWELRLALSPGEEYPILFWSEEGVPAAEAEGAEVVVQELKDGNLHLILLRARAASVRLRLRK